MRELLEVKIMLSVNLRHLEEHGTHLQGELPVAELDFGETDEMIRLEQPLKYDLQVELMHDALLVTGLMQMILDCECVRCLKRFQQNLQLEGWALHLPLEGEDKVSVVNDCVDLTPFVREDMLLEFPQHPLCQPDCQGLKQKRNDSAVKIEEATKPSAWTQLDKLKL